ncbi:MAG: Repressor in ring oxydation complex/ phenylacetic acid degradation pathway related protein (PaaX) [Parcubacteria group bacterium GW2011_GWA2_45_30]|nr:MAG: Repressor in ring oxydation complex/ phenylacetic acid degradation pathway related protein (PaaX) [Parcubacteria group bacterium GW2011_GWA2_45_30]
MAKGPGTIQRKIMLLLLGGLALGLSGTPRRYFRILKLIGSDWRKINRESLWQSIRRLYQSKLVTAHEQKDGSVTLVLSEEGRQRALTYKLDEMRITAPKRWDGKWRIIIFDVPESKKKIRDALRFQFRRLGLKELQKSVFIHPYPCDDEIDFIIELYQARSYVRKIIAESVDTALHWRQKFNIIQ